MSLASSSSRDTPLRSNEFEKGPLAADEKVAILGKQLQEMSAFSAIVLVDERKEIGTPAGQVLIRLAHDPGCDVFELTNFVCREPGARSAFHERDRTIEMLEQAFIGQTGAQITRIYEVGDVDDDVRALVLERENLLEKLVERRDRKEIVRAHDDHLDGWPSPGNVFDVADESRVVHPVPNVICPKAVGIDAGVKLE